MKIEYSVLNFLKSHDQLTNRFFLWLHIISVELAKNSRVTKNASKVYTLMKRSRKLHLLLSTSFGVREVCGYWNIVHKD